MVYGKHEEAGLEGETHGKKSGLGTRLMPDDDVGLELMRLYRDLRSAEDLRSKERIRRLIDATLERARDTQPASYRGIRR